MACPAQPYVLSNPTETDASLRTQAVGNLMASAELYWCTIDSSTFIVQSGRDRANQFQQ